MQSVLDDVNEFRKVALEISKAAAREGKLGERKTEIMQTMDEGYTRMEEHFLTNGSVLEDLTAVQKSLRSLPIVQLHLPTVVLVRSDLSLEYASATHPGCQFVYGEDLPSCPVIS